MKTYTARLEREEDGRWSVELEEEPRVHTWGCTVDQALARVREATALWFQVDEASVGLVPRPVLPKADAKAIDQARQARDQARSADLLAMDQTQKAVSALARRGVSMRDAAAILGMIQRLRTSVPAKMGNVQSPQRASMASLHQQLHVCREEIARLRAENSALKDQLARQLGISRAVSVTSPAMKRGGHVLVVRPGN